MAITQAVAQKEIGVLKKMSGADIFTAMTKSGGYLFRKHLSKKTALAAAQTDHQTKGYFKKVVTTKVPNLKTYKDLTDRQKKHIQGLNAKTPKAQHFSGDKVSTTQTEAISDSDFSSLLYTVITIEHTVGFYQANAEADERFVYVTRVPAGYVGRSIDENEAKTKGLNNAVVIIVASKGQEKPFILNMYPADDQYVARQTALV